jgi:hypothetical protein
MDMPTVHPSTRSAAPNTQLEQGPMREKTTGQQSFRTSEHRQQVLGGNQN